MLNNLLETQEKIIKYFSKKGINIIINEYYNLVWNYKIHYSDFSVILYFQQKEYDDDFYTITYHVVGANIRTYNKKTKASKNFCYTLHKNFLVFQKIFDEHANILKVDTDIKQDYCIELTRYYSRIHHKIIIDVSKRLDEIDINITGYDCKFKPETYYSIKYKNDKYYLMSKTDYTKKEFGELK